MPLIAATMRAIAIRPTRATREFAIRTGADSSVVHRMRCPWRANPVAGRAWRGAGGGDAAVPGAAQTGPLRPKRRPQGEHHLVNGARRR